MTAAEVQTVTEKAEFRPRKDFEARVKEITLVSLPALEDSLIKLEKLAPWHVNKEREQLSRCIELAHSLTSESGDETREQQEAQLFELEMLTDNLKKRLASTVTMLQESLVLQIEWLKNRQFSGRTKFAMDFLHYEAEILGKKLTDASISVHDKISAMARVSSVVDITTQTYEQELRDTRFANNSVKFVIIAFSVIAPLLLGLIVFLLRGAWSPGQSLPVIGIPVSILVWGAIGSFVAMLYRYRSTDPEELAELIKWIVVRPLTGVIMALLLYLALFLIYQAALSIFSIAPAPQSSGDALTLQDYLFWTIAFLGGMSDKFHNAFLDRIVGIPDASKSRRQEPSPPQPVQPPVEWEQQSVAE